MHELFLASLNDVRGEQVGYHLKVLQGVCGMMPVHKYERILTFEGPIEKTTPIPAAKIKSKRPQEQETWNVLNKQLNIMSYYVNVGYTLDEDEFEGRETPQKNLTLDDQPGVLYFADYPDPTSIPQPGNTKQPGRHEQPKTPVNSRMIVYLKNETKLPSMLGSMSYKFKSERVQETYSFYRDNTTLTLSRILVRNVPAEQITYEKVWQSRPKLEDFAPFDGANKWMLKASVEVAEEKAGPLRQRGTDELLAIKKDLSKLYQLEVFDRNVFDTRVPAFLENARKQRMKF